MIDFDHLVLWLSPRKVMGSWWPDLSKYKNNGRMYGAQLKHGVLSFSEVDDHIVVPYSNSLNIYDTQQITAVVWVYMRDDSADPFIHIVLRGQQYEVIWRSSDNTPYFQWHDSNGDPHYFLKDGLNLELNKWHFIAFSMALNGTGVSRKFINGKIVIEKTITYDVCQDTSTSLKIPEITFNGLIGDILIFNKALSEAEIRILYELTSPYGTR